MSITKPFVSILGLALITVLIAAAPLSASAASDSQAKSAVQSTMDSASKKYDEIVEKMKNDLRIYKDVDVEFNDGVAHLTGTVNTKAEKEEVIKLVRAVPGVQSIKDDLKVRGEESGTVGAYIDDASITAEVKAKFLTQKGLDSLDISVETIDGVVTLSGQVDNPAQVSLAEEVAKKVDGTAKVINKLTVKK